MKSSVVCRLSPNEEVSLLRHHRDERRRARLVQVREQERLFARKVREEVKGKREEERRVLEQHLQATLEATHQSEMRELEEKYLSRVGHIGQGHRDAQHINEEESRVQELRMLLAAKQRHRAQDRHTAAMKELTVNQLHEKERRQRVQEAKKCALEAEKQRAKEGATRCLSAPTLIMDLAVDRGQRVRLKEVEGYASSYYHIPHNTVQRMATPDHTMPSAHQLAQEVMEEDKKLGQHSATVRIEQGEMAWLRHKHAMARVRLEKDKSEVMKELKALDRQNRSHRQKALGSMPANMFQPVHRRFEMASEQQKDMEQAFEKLFVKTHGVHTHSALSSIADRTSPERRRSHEQSGLTTLSHPTEPPTDSVSPTIEKSSDGPAPISLAPVSPTLVSPAPVSPTLVSPAPVSPTPVRPKLHLEVPTAVTVSSSLSKTPDLSISDVTPSELVPAQQSLDSVRRPPVAGRDDHEDHRRQPVARQLEQASPAQQRPLGHRRQPVAGRHEEHQQQPVARQLEQASPAQQRPLGRDEDDWRQAVAGRDVDDWRQPVAGRDVDNRRQPVAGRDEEDWRHWVPMKTQPEGQETLPLSRRSEGMQKLVSMIRSQHQAWTERLATRSRLLSESPEPSHGNHTSSSQHESLSIHTLSSRDTTRERQLVARTVGPRSLETTEDSLLVSRDEGSRSPTPRPEDITSSTTPEPLSISAYETTLDQGDLEKPNQQYDFAPCESDDAIDHHLTTTDVFLPTSIVPTPALPRLQMYASHHTPANIHPYQLPYGHYYQLPHPLATSIGASHQHMPDTQGLLVDSSVSAATTTADEIPGVSIHVDTPETMYMEPPLLPDVYMYNPPLQSQDVIDPSVSEIESSQLEVQESRPPEMTPQLSLLTVEPHLSYNVTPPLFHSPDITATSVATDASSFDWLHPGTQSHDTPSPQSTESLSINTPESPSFLSSEVYGRKELTPDHQRDSHLFDSGVVIASTSSATLSAKSSQEKAVPASTQLPSSTSLQDAFLRKRQDFIKHSQSRQKQVEANARERHLQAATLPQLHSHRRLEGSTIPNQHSHRGHRKEATGSVLAPDPTPGEATGLVLAPEEGSHKKPAVTFSSPLYQSEHTGIFTPPEIHRGQVPSQKREKITNREMKERNLRFYSRLPEVRQRKKEERVAQQNAANRERAKQYHQKIRGQLQQKDSRKLINLTKYSAPKQASRSMPPFK